MKKEYGEIRLKDGLTVEKDSQNLTKFLYVVFKGSVGLSTAYLQLLVKLAKQMNSQIGHQVLERDTEEIPKGWVKSTVIFSPVGGKDKLIEMMIKPNGDILHREVPGQMN